MARAIKISSVSGALTVTITGPNGGTPVVYADSSFVNVQTMPATIADTATTTFWLQGPGKYTLSVKTSGGTEIAADNNSTRPVDVETDGTVAALNYDARTLATVSGDSGHSTAGSAASGPPCNRLVVASADTTGVADVAAIQAAIDAVNTAGGGIIDLVGTFWINATLTLKTGVILRGQGMQQTVIGLASAANTTMIQGSTTFAYGGIRDLTIDGFKENQTAGTPYGINLDTVSTLAGDGQWIFIERVQVQFTKSDAVRAGNSGAGAVETRFTDVAALQCGGNGFTIGGSDAFILNCTAGNNLGDGFRITGSGQRLSNCKSWWSGFDVPRNLTRSGTGNGTSSGYWVSGENMTMHGCEAQDNSLYGFKLGADTLTATACNADANFSGAYQLYVNGRRQRVEGVVGNGTSHGHASPFAVGLWDSSTIGNTVRLNWPNNSGGVTAALQSGKAAVATQNDITIGTPAAIVATTYAATVTPDPVLGGPQVTLTGNITIANPAADRYIPNTEFEVVLIQDATGTRTVAWGADYLGMTAADTTANKVNRWRVKCIYNGTAAKWYQTGFQAY